VTGTFPEFKCGNAAAAVLNGFTLSTNLAKTWPDMDTLIQRMLQLDPASRPSIASVQESLVAIRKLEATKERRVYGEKKPGTPVTDGGSRLKGAGLKLVSHSESDVSSRTGMSDVAPTHAPTSGGLKGALLHSKS
jgi:hypothetical protein